MRVIALSTLRSFWALPAHRHAEQALKAWYAEATAAAWTQPADVKARYANASILKGGRVVFNIKGNDYRLIVSISYKQQVVYLKFVGTHVAYDAIDAETVDQTQ